MEKNPEEIQKPSPSILETFLPWACKQLHLDTEIVCHKQMLPGHVTSVHPDHHSKTRGKSKTKMTSTAAYPEQASCLVKDDASANVDSGKFPKIDKSVLQITFIFDGSENLVGLKFNQNSIPRNVMQILGLVIKYQLFLTSITIDRGLNAAVIHELCKFLPLSKITDICLDNCTLKEGNYSILLEKTSCLRSLSLARCLIGDDGVDLITSKLIHPLPASAMLLTLNLSTNRITDVGAKSIGVALRTNEKLEYLNLANNMISDEGVEFILNSLSEFALTDEELLATRRINMEYLKQKNAVITQMMKEQRENDIEKKTFKRKLQATRPISAVPSKKGKGVQKEASNIIISGPNFDGTSYEKAKAMAETTVGPFRHPYSKKNIKLKEDTVCCMGNKTLCYLNLAYNRLSLTSVKKVLNVLIYQKCMNRSPRGLINVCLEGNPLPVSCKELALVDETLEAGLCSFYRHSYTGPFPKKQFKLAKVK